MPDHPPLTIWGRKNSLNVMKVLWCCAELNLPCERIDLGGEFRFDNEPDYLRLNPNGRVPTIRDGTLTLWESNVVVRYLSEKHGRGTLWPQEPSQRWLAEQWMDWMQTTVSPGSGGLTRTLVRTPPEQRDPAAIEAYRQAVLVAWLLLDAHLADRPYVTGTAFTMADIPLGVPAYRWFNLAIERPPLPHLEAWYGRLCEREGYRTHIMNPIT